MESSYSLSDSDEESLIYYSPPESAHWFYDSGVPDWVNLHEGIIRYDHREQENWKTDMDSETESVRSYSDEESDWEDISDNE